MAVQDDTYDINNPLQIQDVVSTRLFEVLLVGKDYPSAIGGVSDFKTLNLTDYRVVVALYGKHKEIIRYYNLDEVVWFGWAR